MEEFYSAPKKSYKNIFKWNSCMGFPSKSKITDIRKIQFTIDKLFPRIKGNRNPRFFAKSKSPDQEVHITERSLPTRTRRSKSHKYMCNNAYSFPTVSRFPSEDQSALEKIVHPMRTSSLESKKLVNLRISEHKKELRNFSFQKIRPKIHSEVATNRQMIHDQTLFYRKEKLERKLKRMKYRALSMNYANLMKGFTRLLTIISLCRFLSTFKGSNYLKIKNSNQKLLMLFSRFIGKMKILLDKNRKERSLRTFAKLLVPLIKLKVHLKREKYRKNVHEFIILYVSNRGLHDILYYWNKNLAFLKRFARKNLEIKKARFHALLIVWNSFYIDLAGGNDNGDEEVKHRLTMPNEVKLFYIRKYIRARVKEYMKLYHVFLDHHAKLRNNWEYRYEYEKSILLNSQVVYRKPVLSLFSSRENLRKYVVKADMNRLNWIRIIQTEMLTRDLKFKSSNSVSNVKKRFLRIRRFFTNI